MKQPTAAPATKTPHIQIAAIISDPLEFFFTRARVVNGPCLSVRQQSGNVFFHDTVADRPPQRSAEDDTAENITMPRVEHSGFYALRHHIFFRPFFGSIPCAVFTASRSFFVGIGISAGASFGMMRENSTFTTFETSAYFSLMSSGTL